MPTDVWSAANFAPAARCLKIEYYSHFRCMLWRKSQAVGRLVPNLGSFRKNVPAGSSFGKNRQPNLALFRKTPVSAETNPNRAGFVWKFRCI
jgi:hypothetical protein